jgi:hypothetical protein
LNVSADSFYSSQGRRDELFHDRSEGKDDRRQGGMRHKNRTTGYDHGSVVKPSLKRCLWLCACAGVLSSLHGAYPGVLSMEMETFQLLALANASTPQVHHPHLEEQETKRPSASPRGPPDACARLCGLV